MAKNKLKMVSPSGVISEVVESAFRKVWEPMGYRLETDEPVLIEEAEAAVEAVVAQVFTEKPAPKLARNQSEQTGQAESSVSTSETEES
jgi:hypothetical protein